MKFYTRMKALSDQTRLRILNLLVFHEFNVNELMQIMKMGQSRISRHLKILSDADFVLSRRDGLWVFYRAATDGLGKTIIEKMYPLFYQEKEFEEDRHQAKSFLRQRREERKKHFDRLSEHWEEIREELFGVLDFSSMFDGIAFKKVAVDLGCGTGASFDLLVSKAEQVIGVDQSQGMISKARLKFRDADFRLGELEHLPLADGEADLALMNMVLHHLETPFDAFQEVARILEAGGHLILIDLKKHHNETLREAYGDRWLGFEESELEVWLQTLGFEMELKKEQKLPAGLSAFIWRALKRK